MKTKNSLPYIRRIMILYLLIIFSSCDRFLELEAPKTELITPLVFSNNSAANAAILSIYARMASTSGVPSRNLSWIAGLSSDEFINYSTNQNIVSFYTNTLLSTNTNVASYLWSPYYNIIFQCNAIIEGLQESLTVTEGVKQQIIAEAKFIRAYCHFYLVNFFGEIPIVISSDYRKNAVLYRSPVAECYQQILNDLLDAKQQLNPDYIGADAITTSQEKVRPNKAVAQALLARLYLYMGRYEEAILEATEIIKQNVYGISLDLNSVFLKNSLEAIWQLQPVPNIITNEADMFVLTGAPSSSINKSVSLSERVLNLFDTKDLRLQNWIGTIKVAEKIYKFPSKYKKSSTGSNTTEYSMIFRLAEQYLIRAEACTHLKQYKEACDDINVLRSRAGLDLIEQQESETLLNLIDKERQRELFSEGHRWFDLKRTGKIDAVMSTTAVSKGSSWNTKAKLFPIPQTERNNNSNLSQNEDY